MVARRDRSTLSLRKVPVFSHSEPLILIDMLQDVAYISHIPYIIIFLFDMRFRSLFLPFLAYIIIILSVELSTEGICLD